MKTSRTLAFIFRSVAWCTAVAASAASGLAACSDGDDSGEGTGAVGGSAAAGGSMGGGAGRGGGGSGATSGSGGAGGSAGTGAAGGSDAGAGGGGDSEAGEGGVGGTFGGAAGASAGEAGAAGDAGAGGSPVAGGTAGAAGAGESGAGGSGGEPGGETIETCFEGLRELEGTSQISTRENAGEQIRLRLALETADRIGTSGTYPWAAIRLALEIDGTLICLDESELASAYMGTHHNCSDELSFDHDGRSYEIGSPDSRGLEAATLTVSSGGSVVRGPVTLTATECVAAGGVSTECRSGGPC